jgi:predicted enzyme related to lactoylglutathione lyase
VVKFVHTNLVAYDWQRLASFYQAVFGCEPVLPERCLSGVWLDRATCLQQARLQGIHLRLPGYGTDGPTLEIFEYDAHAEGRPHLPNVPGFAHIAFAVDNVQKTCEAIISNGGGMIGDRVEVEIAGAGLVEFAYATDPEGNIIEVQRWKE